jgi:hypothetical protein
MAAFGLIGPNRDQAESSFTSQKDKTGGPTQVEPPVLFFRLLL